MKSRGTAGTIDPGHVSNINFLKHEVANNLNAVLFMIEESKKCSRDRLIAAAMFGRCFALDIFLISNSVIVTPWIDMTLNHGSKGWSLSDFLAACILLRGCAKSLLAIKANKITEWRSHFEHHLRDQDFVLKCHAAVSI